MFALIFIPFYLVSSLDTHKIMENWMLWKRYKEEIVQTKTEILWLIEPSLSRKQVEVVRAHVILKQSYPTQTVSGCILIHL